MKGNYMRLVFKRSEIILIMVFLGIALLGVSYSSWSHSGMLFGAVTTGQMDYEFDKGCINVVHKDGTKELISADINIISGKV
jgi:hypothetical protein